MHQNADLEGTLLDQTTMLDTPARALLTSAADRFGLSARGYHRVLRVARSIADLDTTDSITRDHIAEALSYRLPQNTT
jgi:magnesium chelatase family protein